MPQQSYYALLGIPDFSPYSVCRRAWKERVSSGIAQLTHEELKAYSAAWYTLRDNARKYHYDVALQKQYDNLV